VKADQETRSVAFLKSIRANSSTAQERDIAFKTLLSPKLSPTSGRKEEKRWKKTFGERTTLSDYGGTLSPRNLFWISKTPSWQISLNDTLSKTKNQ
jgi:hypothetical protein